MSYWKSKRTLILGGSSGLGRTLAEVLLDRGARVAVVGRGQEALDRVVVELGTADEELLTFSADVTCAADVERVAIQLKEKWHGVDLVVHAAGRSMRGDAITTAPEQFQELWELNFLSAVRVTQAFASDLIHSRGHLVLVGSLAGKCAPRYLGAYPASKYPLAAFAQQLRLELGPRGMHTLLVSPGPIARSNEDPRYADQVAGLPASAQRPGGGARLKLIDPVVLSKRILAACESRASELVVPAKTKLLFALAQFWPTVADRILQKKTSE